MKAARLAEGWTQDVLAWRLRRYGLDWSRDQVASLEALRRLNLELGEAVQLAQALGLRVADLFKGSGDVVIGSVSVPLGVLRDQLSGLQPPSATESPDDVPYSDAERGWGRQLGLRPSELRRLSRAKWEGRTVDEELERLLDNPPAHLSTMTPVSQEAMLRRELFAELRNALDDERP